MPQGSVLGPLLFLFDVNDLPLFVKNCAIKIYAEDVKVYILISNNDDCVLILSDLTAIEAWFDLWCLPLNIEKG